jgi:hypothetical protein
MWDGVLEMKVCLRVGVVKVEPDDEEVGKQLGVKVVMLVGNQVVDEVNIQMAGCVLVLVTEKVNEKAALGVEEVWVWLRGMWLWLWGLEVLVAREAMVEALTGVVVEADEGEEV